MVWKRDSRLIFGHVAFEIWSSNQVRLSLRHWAVTYLAVEVADTKHSVRYFLFEFLFNSPKNFTRQGYYVHFLIKIVEVQGNLSNLPSVIGVIGSPRILIYISLTSLCLIYSPMLTHLFSRNEKFVLINFFYSDIKSGSPD